MKRKAAVEIVIVLLLVLIGALFFVSNQQSPKESDINSAQLVQPNLNSQVNKNLNTSLPEPEPEPITVLMLGDMMLDRYVSSSIKQNGSEHPFANITDFLKEPDLTVVNLEGCFTDFAPRALDPNNLVFTFDPALASVLAATGFDIVSLANNHSFNMGQAGLDQCKQYLFDERLDYFGHPHNTENVSQIVEVGDKRIGFAGYSELGTSNFSQIIDEVSITAPLVDFMIVFPHWGAEYQKINSTNQQTKAHQLIDAGVNAVIGAHPHVIQNIEIYQNQPIFYSLGNFLFDQTFSEATMQGLAVKLRISDSEVDYYLYPLGISRGMQTSLIEQQKGDIILKEIADNSTVEDSIKEQIIQGKFTIEQ